MSFFFSSSSLISFVTFMTYVLSGSYLTSQKVFTSIALFNAARLIMTLYFPIGITLINEARVSMERMQVTNVYQIQVACFFKNAMDKNLLGNC